LLSLKAFNTCSKFWESYTPPAIRIRVKRKLVGQKLTQETLKKKWEGTVRTLSMVDFATAFRWRYNCCKKCLKIAGGNDEKS
jgi:hypothetical protein